MRNRIYCKEYYNNSNQHEKVSNDLNNEFVNENPSYKCEIQDFFKNTKSRFFVSITIRSCRKGGLNDILKDIVNRMNRKFDKERKKVRGIGIIEKNRQEKICFRFLLEKNDVFSGISFSCFKDSLIRAFVGAKYIKDESSINMEEIKDKDRICEYFPNLMNAPSNFKNIKFIGDDTIY